MTNNADQLMQDLHEILEKGGQFVMEQAPPVAREIVVFGRVWETAFFLILLALVVLFYKGLRKSIAAVRDDDPDWAIPAIILSVVGGFASGLFLLGEVRDLCLVWLAPRLYLIEYVAHLVKSGK